MKHYFLVKHQLKPTAAKKEPTITEVSEKVAVTVEKMWLRVSLLLISHTQILKMLCSYHDKYIKLLQNINRSNYDGNMNTFKEDARDKLFDICTCKCLRNVSVAKLSRFLLQSKISSKIREHSS